MKLSLIMKKAIVNLYKGRCSTYGLDGHEEHCGHHNTMNALYRKELVFCAQGGEYELTAKGREVAAMFADKDERNEQSDKL